MDQNENLKLALQVLVMPADLNNHGSLFGGTMLSYLDQAGAIIAANHAQQPIVLASVKNADFLLPCYSGDQIQFWGKITKVGRTSMTVTIEASRKSIVDPEEETELSTTAELVYVAVDENKKPTKVELRI